MSRTFVVVEARPPARPVLRELALRTGDCFEALRDADLEPWSGAEPDWTGADEADWRVDVEVNVEAAMTPEPVAPEPVVPEAAVPGPAVPGSAGAAVLTGEAVEVLPWVVDVAPATGRTL